MCSRLVVEKVKQHKQQRRYVFHEMNFNELVLKQENGNMRNIEMKQRLLYVK